MFFFRDDNVGHSEPKCSTTRNTVQSPWGGARCASALGVVSGDGARRVAVGARGVWSLFCGPLFSVVLRPSRDANHRTQSKPQSPFFEWRRHTAWRRIFVGARCRLPTLLACGCGVGESVSPRAFALCVRVCAPVLMVCFFKWGGGAAALRGS